jgi:ketosteroid isomerase-like protein
MVPGPALSGRQAIENCYRALFAKGWSGHVFKFDQVHMTDDTTWAVGSWSANGPGPNEAVQQYHRNWGSAYGKEGTAWKIQMLTWNIIQAPPGK